TNKSKPNDVKIPTNATQLAILIDIHFIILFLLAPIDIPIKAAICVPVKSGPSKAEPITPYFLNISTALVFRFEVLPCFSRRRIYYFLILSNIKITGITVIIFPKQPTIITITGDSPQTIPSGTTIDTSSHGIAAPRKTSKYWYKIIIHLFLDTLNLP